MQHLVNLELIYVTACRNPVTAGLFTKTPNSPVLVMRTGAILTGQDYAPVLAENSDNICSVT